MHRVSVLLTNRFATFLKPYPLEDLQPYFSFHPAGYRFVPAYRNGYWDGYVRLLKRSKVPTGLFIASREKIQQELGIQFEISKQFSPIEFRTLGPVSDRDFQNECVERMIAAAQHHGGGMVLAATGSGKTRTAGMFFRLLKGRACFIVDQLDLLYQAQNELVSILDEDVGVVGNSEFDPRRITVATSQTLSIHQEDPDYEPWTLSLKVNIIDELHEAMNRRTFGIVEAIAPPAVFGLTATLQLQKKDVWIRAHALTGPVCYEYALDQGQKEGHLAQGVVVQVMKTTYSEGDYGAHQHAQEYSNLIVANVPRNRIILDLVREADKRGYFCIVLVERVNHLKGLSERLSDIPHKVVYGEKKIEERIVSRQEFETSKIRLLIANKVFRKGIDIKKVDVLIDAAAMKDKNRAVQVFGRGVRLAADKLGLLHFDIGDVVVTPAHTEKKQKHRFTKATNWRRSAFKKKLIPVERIDWDKNASEVFDLAERMLKKKLGKHQVQKSFNFTGTEVKDAPVYDGQ